MSLLLLLFPLTLCGSHTPSSKDFSQFVEGGCCKLVNLVLNVHINRKAYQRRGEGGKGVWMWGERETIIPIATLSPPE